MVPTEPDGSKTDQPGQSTRFVLYIGGLLAVVSFLTATTVMSSLGPMATVECLWLGTVTTLAALGYSVSGAPSL